MENIFSELYHDIKNTLICKVGFNLAALFCLNIIEKKNCPGLSSFLYCLLKTMKLFNMCYLLLSISKSLVNDDSFK